MPLPRPILTMGGCRDKILRRRAFPLLLCDYGSVQYQGSRWLWGSSRSSWFIPCGIDGNGSGIRLSTQGSPEEGQAQGGQEGRLLLVRRSMAAIVGLVEEDRLLHGFQLGRHLAG